MTDLTLALNRNISFFKAWSAKSFLIMSAIVIFTLGLMMIYSTTSADVLDQIREKGEHTQLLKQLGYAVCGVGLSFAVVKMGWRNFISYSPLLMKIIVLLLVLTLIPGIGREVNGSKRWLSFGGISFQPSEFAKLIIPTYFLHYYFKFYTSEFELTLKAFLKLVARTLVPILLIMIEPNNGTAMVILLALIVAFFLTKIPFKYWAWPLLSMCLIGGLFVSQLPYVQKRLKVYVDPESDLRGKGHQPYQAKIAIGSGGFLGKGPAKSLQKLSYLPEAQNDYIAAIFAEELGFLGIFVLIILYMILGAAGFSIAFSCPDLSGSALAGISTFLILFQAFMNLGVVSGLLPSTGLNLPLFSQGGTSLMANMATLALLYQIGSEKREECTV